MEPLLLGNHRPEPGRTGLVLSVCLALLACGCSFDAVYFPEQAIRATPAHLNLGYEDAAFETTDGVRLAGWWVPADRPRGTVLFCHGNGGNISFCMDTLRTAGALGLNVLLFDYRGYGNSAGSPTEQGTYRDAEAAWEYLVREKGIAPETIVIWGRSLGGAVAAHTAARLPSGLLVLESAFTSIPELMRDRFPWVPAWMAGGHVYDTRGSLEKVGVPVLVIHSPDDEIIPYAHGKVLYESAREPRAFVEIRGSHNRGFMESRDVYEASIGDFIGSHLAEREKVHP